MTNYCRILHLGCKLANIWVDKKLRKSFCNVDLFDRYIVTNYWRILHLRFK